MDARIGRLGCRYRVVGTRSLAAAVSTRFDRVARERVAEVWADALGEVLGDDPTVYVIRRLEAPLAVMDARLPDTDVARRWGGRLAWAVVRQIADDPGDGDDLVRFADQAEYVARFVVELLDGTAWRRWFFGAFSSLRHRSVPDAIRGVLLDHVAQLPAILSRLQRSGDLDRLLALLDPPTIQTLWAAGLAVPARTDPEAASPFVAAAFQLVDRLELWARPLEDRAGLHHDTLSFVGPVDWRDRRALAVAVLAVVRFLVERGYLRRAGDAERRAVLARLDRALPALDWADGPWLRSELAELLAAPEVVVRRRPGRARPGPTPRQIELLADLEAAVRQARASLDRAAPASPANALRLYATLVARAPRWSGDPAASSTIESLLAAGVAVASAPSSRSVIARLRHGDLDGALRLLPDRFQADGAALKRAADLGESGLKLVAALAEVDVASSSDGVKTRCAGLFLLLRAVLDARLRHLAQGAAYPTPGLVTAEGDAQSGAILAALGLRWAGDAALEDGAVDPGLALLAGLAEPPTHGGLRAAWQQTVPADHHRFQAGLLEMLAGQRLLGDAALHVYQVMVAGRRALVAADETARLWPLGRVVDADDDVGAVIAAWLDVWEQATGCRPATVVVDEALAASLPRDAFGADAALVAAPEPGAPEMPSVDAASPDEADGPGASIAAHLAGRDALTAALGSLDAGLLGLADADLTLGLTGTALIRLWARWLGPFSDSSVPYVLETFIRRPGRLYQDSRTITVELESRPLDVVLEMAGFAAEIDQVGWLGQRSVRFATRGTA